MKKCLDCIYNGTCEKVCEEMTEISASTPAVIQIMNSNGEGGIFIYSYYVELTPSMYNLLDEMVENEIIMSWKVLDPIDLTKR